MLSDQEMTCIDCTSSANTSLELQVDRGGNLVRFRVDCSSCGGFSHYLEYNEMNRAVKRYLGRLSKAAIIATRTSSAAN